MVQAAEARDHLERIDFSSQHWSIIECSCIGMASVPRALLFCPVKDGSTFSRVIGHVSMYATVSLSGALSRPCTGSAYLNLTRKAACTSAFLSDGAPRPAGCVQNPSLNLLPPFHPYIASFLQISLLSLLTSILIFLFDATVPPLFYLVRLPAMF